MPSPGRTLSALVYLTLAMAMLIGNVSPAARGSEAEGSKPAADELSVRVGDKVGAFAFTDIRYLPRTLDELGEKNAYVFVFTTLECPIVRRYLPRLKALDEAYRDKGVQFVALNVGQDDPMTEVAYQAVKADIAFPFGKDYDGSAARALGATRTPEVCVLDAQRRLRYRGRIDNGIRFAGVRPKTTRADLRAALDDLLAGREVAVKETPVDGCLISFPEQHYKPERTVTYHQHVAPLLARHCQRCHRPDSTGPFEMLTYRDAAAHAEMIGEVVAQRRMPPWYASVEHGKFINDARLPDDERQTILDWVAGGRAEGDPESAAPLPEVPKVGWRIGKPDQVITMLSAQKLPAEGYIKYRYAVLPYLFTADTWVQAIEIRPGNPRVVHHANLGHIRLGSRPDAESAFITGYVPGGQPLVTFDHIGYMIPAGSVLVLQLHYVTTGEETTDRTSVGIRFARERIDKRLQHYQCTTRRFSISPGDPHYKVSTSETFDCNASIVGLFAHMHLRGKDMVFDATYPDGRQERLLAVPNYSFDWQMAYVAEQGKLKLPKGTRIDCTAHYDNSPFNPFNPDPKAAVHFGPQTYHEMLYGFVFFTDDDEKLAIEVNPKTGRVVSAANNRK